MTLVLKGLPQVSQDVKYVWFTDKTGEYLVTTNEGGWGSPNFELAQSAILLFVYRMSNPKALLDLVADVKHVPTAANTDELVFQGTYINDGSHQFNSVRLMVSSDDANSIDTVPIVFTNGSIWYNSVDGLVKEMISGVPTAIDLTDTDALDAILTNSSVSTLLCEVIWMSKLGVERNNKYNNQRQARREENGQQVQRMRDDQSDITHDSASALYNFGFGEKILAHDIVESSLDRFNLN